MDGAAFELDAASATSDGHRDRREPLRGRVTRRDEVKHGGEERGFERLQRHEREAVSSQVSLGHRIEEVGVRTQTLREGRKMRVGGITYGVTQRR